MADYDYNVEKLDPRHIRVIKRNGGPGNAEQAPIEAIKTTNCDRITVRDNFTSK
jgi:hypothetical protein